MTPWPIPSVHCPHRDREVGVADLAGGVVVRRRGRRYIVATRRWLHDGMSACIPYGQSGMTQVNEGGTLSHFVKARGTYNGLSRFEA